MCTVVEAVEDLAVPVHNVHGAGEHERGHLHALHTAAGEHRHERRGVLGGEIELLRRDLDERRAVGVVPRSVDQRHQLEERSGRERVRAPGPAPHEHFSDVYEKMCGKGESAREAHVRSVGT
eukprot:COSAG03_NODE_6108_length_1115_cov_7.039370_2_plen_122_part_00